jgi:ribonuclease P protein component
VKPSEVSLVAGLTTPSVSLAKFTRRHRLSSAEVQRVLKQGKRTVVRSTDTGKPRLEARTFAAPMAAEEMSRLSPFRKSNGARLAVAVPKRLLKRAVDRNLVKRWMREAFRRYNVRDLAVDTLFTLCAKVDLAKSAPRHELRKQIDELVTQAITAKSLRPTIKGA